MYRSIQNFNISPRAFYIWIFGRGNPNLPSKNVLKSPILGSYKAIKWPFSSSILKNIRLLN